jgi:hypothetical protein
MTLKQWGGKKGILLYADTSSLLDRKVDCPLLPSCATGVARNDMWTGAPKRVKTIAVLRAVDLALPGLPG